MKAFITLATLAIFAAAQAAEKCPSGGEIYDLGISAEGKVKVVAEHNRYRQMINDGKVPNQPKGKGVKMITSHDDNLAKEGRKVSEVCKMTHITATDSRWKWVGQNLYMSCSSVNSSDQKWEDAVKSWYDEHKDFIYPDKKTGVTGHYTQVIWDNTDVIGCDFVRYYDASQPKFPYCKLYTCNYGPGGNYVGQAPYQLA